MYFITALILGLVVALNPCQLAINLSALTFLQQRSNDNRWFRISGWFYVAGRTVTYTLLGWALTWVLRRGGNIDAVHRCLSWGELALPYILLIVGVYLLIRTFHHHDHHGDECHSCGQIIKRTGRSGAFVIGLMLAFAFCPESAIVYFGMMLPMTLLRTLGWCLPPLFALSAALPVLTLLYLMAGTSKGVQRFMKAFSHFQQWMNAVLAIAFLIAAAILIVRSF